MDTIIEKGSLRIIIHNVQPRPPQPTPEPSMRYDAVHAWMRRTFGKPSKCEKCGVASVDGKTIQWSNKDHTYRRVRDDWWQLCCYCHWEHDKAMREARRA